MCGVVPKLATLVCHEPVSRAAPFRTYVNITATGRPYSGFGLPTTKHEIMLDMPTISYKIATGRPYSGLGLPTTKYEKMLDISILSHKSCHGQI